MKSPETIFLLEEALYKKLDPEGYKLKVKTYKVCFYSSLSSLLLLFFFFCFYSILFDFILLFYFFVELIS